MKDTKEKFFLISVDNWTAVFFGTEEEANTELIANRKWKGGESSFLDHVSVLADCMFNMDMLWEKLSWDSVEQKSEVELLVVAHKEGQVAKEIEWLKNNIQDRKERMAEASKALDLAIDEVKTCPRAFRLRLAKEVSTQANEFESQANALDEFTDKLAKLQKVVA